MDSKILISLLLCMMGNIGNAFNWGGKTDDSDSGETTPNKRDCRWADWEGTQCQHVGNYVYKIKQTRRQIPARNGGAPCIGESTRQIPCGSIEYTASAFYDTVTSSTNEASLISRSSENTVPNPFAKDSCKENTHTDGSGTLRMFGKTCADPVGGGRAARVKRSGEVLSIKHRSVLFLIDESGSVNAKNFRLEMNMARAITSKLCGAIGIGKTTTRVGIMTFDKEKHIHLDFDQLFKRHEILKHMDGIQYNAKTAGATCLSDALEYSLRSVIIPERGARNKVTGTERVVVLITDGCANCKDQASLPNALKFMRTRFEKEKIPIITFFVGENTTCVKIMGGLADGSRCYQVFRAKNWDEFEQMIKHIEGRECMDAWEIGPECPA